MTAATADTRHRKAPPHYRTMLLVTVLTVLIWVFAEGETLRTTTRRVDIDVLTGSSTLVVEIGRDQPWSGWADVRFEGTALGLDRLREVLEGVVPLTAGADFPATPGQHVIDLREALRNHESLARTGVTVVEVDPPLLTVVLDELVQHEIGVRVDAPEGRLVGPPEVVPERVSLTLPASVAKRYEQELAGMQAVAQVEEQRLAALTPGQRERLLDVPLRAPPELAGQSFVTLSPARADVVLTLPFRARNIVLPSVPVQVRLAAVEFNNWEVVVPEQGRQILNVRVSGPDELIDRIESGELSVVATVPLDFEELERGISEKRAEFSHLPTQLRFEAADTLIPLQIRRRSDVPIDPATD